MKPVWKGCLLCDPNCDILEKQNCGDSKKIGGCQGLGDGREGWNGWNTIDFYRNDTILYDTVMVSWYIHVIIHFSEPTECTTEWALV